MGQHAAWRHLKVDMPGGIFRGSPGRPVRLPGRLQHAFAAGPRARSRPSGIIDRWPAASWRCCGYWRRAGQTRPVPANWWSPGHGQRHVGHVLGKLGAASRTESVARARVL